MAHVNISNNINNFFIASTFISYSHTKLVSKTLVNDKITNKARQ